MDVDRAGVLGRGRRRRPDRAASRHRRSRRCAACPRTPRSTWRSSTPTRAATSATGRSSCPGSGPGGVLLIDNTLQGGAVIDADQHGRAGGGDPPVQRPRRRRQPGRAGRASDQRRCHDGGQAMTSVAPPRGPGRHRRGACQRHGPVRVVTIDRPGRRNAVDRPTAAALVDAFRDLRRRSDERGGGADRKRRHVLLRCRPQGGGDRGGQPGHRGGRRADGADTTAADQAGHRGDRGLRRGRRARARAVVRPARWRHATRPSACSAGASGCRSSTSARSDCPA